jgi:hypothetical protein
MLAVAEDDSRGYTDDEKAAIRACRVPDTAMVTVAPLGSNQGGESGNKYLVNEQLKLLKK